VHDSLVDYERSRGTQNPRRVSHLLFCLPLLQQLKLLAKNYWCSVKKTGQVPLHKLLNEMLDFPAV
jgi:hypothetical protein